MQNAAARFKIWSSKHNIWIYLIVLLLLGIYALHKITTTDVLARIDTVLQTTKLFKQRYSLFLHVILFYILFYNSELFISNLYTKKSNSLTWEEVNGIRNIHNEIQTTNLI